MQNSQITKHFRARGNLLLSGQFDRMAADFAYPLPIFLHSSRLLIASPEQAATVFRQLRDALALRGVVELRPRVSAIELPRAGRFRVWVDWQEIAPSSEETRFSQAVYFCRHTDSGLITEMVNYIRLSMPELDRKFAALALSA